MTEAQRTRFYFPAWGKACHANDWHMVKGRLLAKRAKQHGVPDVDALYQSIWNAAEALALQAHRAVTAEDLRHACHVVAVGRDKSANDLTNGEVDKVVNLFRLLAEPDDLDAILAIQHPENSERTRLVHSLKKRAPEAKLLAIARNLKTWSGEWEPPFWEDMPIEALKTLSRIIARDQKQWNQPVAAPPVAAPLASAAVEEPF